LFDHETSGLREKCAVNYFIEIFEISGHLISLKYLTIPMDKK
jgi:hypothetical protein